MRIINLALALVMLGLLIVATTSCASPTYPANTATNIVCPTGCVLPPGCSTALSPVERPVGYKVNCQ